MLDPSSSFLDMGLAYPATGQDEPQGNLSAPACCWRVCVSATTRTLMRGLGG